MKWPIELRDEERRPAWVAFFTLLGTTAAHTVLETARDALFLTSLPASRLPWMVLAIAALGLALSRVGSRERGRPAGAKVSLALVVVASVTAAFWPLLGASARPAALYALYAWAGVAAAWVVLEFWLVLGAAFTIAQAKRLFAFVGVGGVLGAVLGAGGARLLAPSLGARGLVLASALLFLATAAGPAMLPRPGPSRGRGRARAAATPLPRDPYVVRVFALALSSTIALTIVDYLFKAAAARHVEPGRLAEFFATSYLAMGSLSLVVQLAGVGWALRVLGVHRALLVLPSLVVLGAAGAVVTGGLLATALMKGADGALRHSLHRTSTELLYVPIADRARERLKPLVDLVGQRGGQAVASALVLLLAPLGKGQAPLAVAVAAFGAAWAFVAVGLRRHYLDVFRSTLREGRLDEGARLPGLDLGALETLMAALNSKDDAEVLAALDLLAQQSRRRLIPALILHHPSKTVVLRALELFVQERRDDFVPTAERLLRHPDADVRAAALRAAAAVAPNEALLAAHVDDGDPPVRATAIVHLVRHGWLAGEDAARRLDAAAADPDRAARAALARAIALEPSERFAPTLARIAEGERDPEVLAEVAAAMGRMPAAPFLPALIRLLGVRDVGPAATEALAALGAPALEALAAAAKDPGTPREVAWNVPRAVSRFDARRAAPILLDLLLGAPDGVVRYRSLRGLCHLRGVDPDAPIDQSRLSFAAETAMREAVRDLEARVVLSRGAAADPGRATAANELLCAMLRDKEAMAVGRLFLLLGLLHPAESFQNVYRGLAADDPKRRASSRELCEHVVLPSLRPGVLALIDDAPDEERLERGGALYGTAGLDYYEQLRALAARSEALTFLATAHAAELGATLTRPEGAPSGPERDPLSMRHGEGSLRDELSSRLRAGRTPAGLHLVGADLRRLDLAGADFSKLDLTGADLRGCPLRGASLRGAVLVGAKLGGADLEGADLEGADLRGASLDRARLERARLGGANFGGATGPGAVFAKAEGRGPTFAGGQWKEADFRHADLPSADFSGATLTAARFDGAKLSSACFFEANAKAAVFDGALAEGASFDGATLARCSFGGLVAQNSTWKRSVASSCSFEGATLDGADFERLTCKSVGFRGARLEGAAFRGAMGLACDFEGACLSGADLGGAHFRGATFVGARLCDVRARRTTLTDCLLRGADLRGADLTEGILRDADLTETILDGANLLLCDLKGAKRKGATPAAAPPTARAGAAPLPEA